MSATQSGTGYTLFDTAFGPCGLAWSSAGLTRLQLPERDRTATEARLCRRGDYQVTQPTPIAARAIAALKTYFDGQRVDFDELSLDLSGVPEFHARTYAATRRLGWGQTTTYGELAAELGSTGAARAIGQAMGRNPIPIIIPCHRVLASGRKIGGFSAYGGALTKERLLTMEGVRLGGEAPLLDLIAQAGGNADRR
jgi:methylated-DNA-[protein]-cysteine S-methyltransferase